MILSRGDMWNIWNETDHFIITTNRIIKRNGAVVMGRGIAKTVRDKWPGVDVQFGNAIKANINEFGFYGVILGKKLGLFQVKEHWASKADPGLISASSSALNEYACTYPDQRFDLNFPGIGNGQLKYEDVLPLLADLPDNVHIWTFE